MKNLIALFILVISCVASADRFCGGTCVNTTSRHFMNSVCANAQEGGKVSCEQFSLVGCAWKDANVQIVRAAKCVNATNDRTLKCESATVEKGCLAVKGCAWFPATMMCPR